MPKSPLQIPSPLESAERYDPQWSFSLKRDDCIHPVISGNKWRKLMGFLNGQMPEGIATFGGPFSNHLHATAGWGAMNGLPTMGWVRGEEADLENPTLKDCRRWGMTLRPLPRKLYDRYKYGVGMPPNWEKIPKGYEVIPEGGAGSKGLAGMEILAEEIMGQCPGGCETVVLPVGSGTTAVGLAKYLPFKVRVIGIACVRDRKLKQRWQQQFPDEEVERIELQYDFAGKSFASKNPQHLHWMRKMKNEKGLALDFVYNAKAFGGLLTMIQRGSITNDPSTVYLHTGGLQGNRGLEYMAARTGR